MWQYREISFGDPPVPTSPWKDAPDEQFVRRNIKGFCKRNQVSLGYTLAWMRSHPDQVFVTIFRQYRFHKED